jgi:hypothetical protein
MDSVELARHYSEAALRPGATDKEVAPLAGPVLAALHGPSDPAVPAVLGELAPVIAEAPADIAALTATMVGWLCERGVDPGSAASPFVDRFLATVDAAHEFFVAIATRVADRLSRGLTVRTPDGERDIYAEENAARTELVPTMPDQAAAWDLLMALLPASTAIFGTSPDAKQAALPALGKLQTMSQSHEAAGWLSEMLRVLDDAPYVAIEPATGRGIRGRMTGVADNFQLNVLIMNAFPRDPTELPRVSASAVELALGHGPQETDETITGTWNLYEWPALARDGALPPAHGQVGTTHWIWNEGVPADIPVFGTERVIVLGPPTYVRTWRAQRAFAYLQATFTVEQTLTEEEVNDLVQSIAATPRVG